MKGIKILGFAAIAWATIGGSAYAKFAPDNDGYLQDNLDQFNRMKAEERSHHHHGGDSGDTTGGITQDQFNAVIDKEEAIFKPLAQAFGGSYHVNRKWDDSTVNADSEREGDSWIVNMYGGLARRPTMTVDGFALVLCHETGHQFGGFPFANDWAADEGQADYFATTHCARMVFGADAETNATFVDKVDPTAKKKCDAMTTKSTERNLCYRTMVASKALGDTLASLSGDSVSFDTHDDSEVDSTDDDHPGSQCRLDTYVAGALCTASWDGSVIPGFHDDEGSNDTTAEKESAKYYCAEGAEGVTVGFRPHCWFKPGI